MRHNANPNTLERTYLSKADRAAREAIRSLLDGSPVEQLPSEDYGRWARYVQALQEVRAQSDNGAVHTAWSALTRVEPALEELLSANDQPLAGIDDEIREILRPGCTSELPELPSLEEAQELADLAEFIDHVTVVPGLKTRVRSLAVCHVMRSLLLARERLLLDTATGARPGKLYIIGDGGGIWPLSAKSLPVQALLARAGLNINETASKWVVGSLRAAYGQALEVRLERYWCYRDEAVYVSSGPTQLVRAVVEGTRVDLQLLPNGTDGIYFAGDGVIPTWEPTQEPVAIEEVSAFRPMIVAPHRVPTYTPEVQLRLLDTYMVGLVAGIRPLPILAAIGGKGGGKTNLIKAVCLAVGADMPTSLSSRQRDMWTLAANYPVLGLDNVDSAPPAWFPDYLAALTTGVTYARRKLYSNAEANRADPRAGLAISTRTARFARPDVADRTLPIFTGVFEDEDRKGDADLIGQVVDNRDGVLTYLCERAAQLRRRLPDAPTLPCRFVDFGRVLWALSSETAVDDLEALRRAQALTVGDADELIRAILDCSYDLLDAGGSWEGSASRLRTRLNELGAGLHASISGREIARRLREGAASLQLLGIQLGERRSGNNTVFTLTRKE